MLLVRDPMMWEAVTVAVFRVGTVGSKGIVEVPSAEGYRVFWSPAEPA